MLNLNKKISNLGFVGILIFLIVLIPLEQSVSNTIAQTRNECEEGLNNAKKKMETGKFDEAIQLITDCLNKYEISNEKKIQAYRLLGLTYIAKDYLGEARNAIQKLLEVVPNYQPDPEQDPPTFVDIVNEQIAQRMIPIQEKKNISEEKEGKSNLWLWITGGVALVATAVVILISGGDDGGSDSSNSNKTLSEPPPLPVP